MTNLRQVLIDKGYNPRTLSKEVGVLFGLTSRRINQILKDPGPMHIYAVNGLPTKPGNTRGEWT